MTGGMFGRPFSNIALQLFSVSLFQRALYLWASNVPFVVWSKSKMSPLHFEQPLEIVVRHGFIAAGFLKTMNIIIHQFSQQYCQ